MENIENKILGLKDHCIFTSIKDEAVFLDANEKKYHTVNSSAAFILRALAVEHGVSFADLKAKVLTKYNVDEKTATSQLKDFLKDLARLNFLQMTSQVAMERPTISLSGEISTPLAAAPIGKGRSARR
jgi:hypothetical protein